MTTLPVEIIAVLAEFAPLFRRDIWASVQVLVIGAILAPGKRTVTTVLRVMGLSQEAQFQKYHRLLNRSRWSSLAVSRVLLHLLVAAFVPANAPIVVGLDETIERRRGAKIAARGVYRDPVRSSQSHFVKVNGLRWICLMLLVPIPWARRVWALPFLTALAPSERYYEARNKRAKKITDWGRQMLLQLRRWLPERQIVVVADMTYAVIDLLARCARLAHPVMLVTRLRLDAALYDPPPVRTRPNRGRPQRKGARQPALAQRLESPETHWEAVEVAWYGRTQRTIELASGTALWFHAGKPPVSIRWVLVRDPLARFTPQALLCTDPACTPAQIVSWFVQRWQVEVTLQETRAHLGLETQRQWNPHAILRTTPALLGLFSFVTLCAHRLLQGADLPPRQSAWYVKEVATFADTLAFVRSHLWPVALFSMSPADPDVVFIPRSAFRHVRDLLAFAA